MDFFFYGRQEFFEAKKTAKFSEENACKKDKIKIKCAN